MYRAFVCPSNIKNWLPLNNLKKLVWMYPIPSADLQCETAYPSNHRVLVILITHIDGLPITLLFTKWHFRHLIDCSPANPKWSFPIILVRYTSINKVDFEISHHPKSLSPLPASSIQSSTIDDWFGIKVPTKFHSFSQLAATHQVIARLTIIKPPLSVI